MAGVAEPRVRIAVSACLVGHEVRYDGRHKRDPYLAGELGTRVDWVPVCPELDIGLGVPREPIHLVAGEGDVLLVGIHSGDEHTGAMRSYAEQRAEQLVGAGIDGYVLKASSPSCGLGDIPVHDPVSGDVIDHERGRFAAVLTRQEPLLPVAEEVDLTLPAARDRFLEQVCARHRWRRLGGDPGVDDLAVFHRRHDMQVMAHSPDLARELGRIAAGSGDGDPQGTASRYRRTLVAALRAPTTRERHVAVLRHLARRVGTSVPSLTVAIDRFADGDISWHDVTERLRASSAVPDRVREQTYLDPLAELGLSPTSW